MNLRLLDHRVFKLLSLTFEGGVSAKELLALTVPIGKIPQEVVLVVVAVVMTLLLLLGATLLLLKGRTSGESPVVDPSLLLVGDRAA